jgi:hypothetical protein
VTDDVGDAVGETVGDTVGDAVGAAVALGLSTAAPEYVISALVFTENVAMVVVAAGFKVVSQF